MKKLFVLSKSHLTLAAAEVLSLLKPEEFSLMDNLLIVEEKTDLHLEARLGFTHAIYEHLFSCKAEELRDQILAFDWQKHYETHFCARSHGDSDMPEKELGSMIFRKLKDPRVKLDGPKTEFHFFNSGNTVVCALLVHDVDKSYLNRKAHLRPSLHPTSMHPGLVRCCINLTGRVSGTLLDPLCGSGGFLIEASLMGFKVFGNDLDPGQIERSKNNLEFYSIKDCMLSNIDATKMNMLADCIVTDLPYGKSSKAKSLIPLYSDFIKNAEKMSDVMVIIFPNFIDHEKIIAKSNWKITKEFNYYVHRSLSRTIVLMNLSH